MTLRLRARPGYPAGNGVTVTQSKPKEVASRSSYERSVREIAAPLRFIVQTAFALSACMAMGRKSEVVRAGGRDGSGAGPASQSDRHTAPSAVLPWA
eukprot:6228009-Prymnesium_polylepis.1